MAESHAYLRVESEGGVEPVHVEWFEGRRCRVLYSPSLVYGVAAGDEIEVGDDGSFHVLHRGGNVVIRVLCGDGVASFAEELERKVVTSLSGSLDGRVRNGLAFTIPIAAGFQKIERVFEELHDTIEGIHWEYGNVYDREGMELGWWK